MTTIRRTPAQVAPIETVPTEPASDTDTSDGSSVIVVRRSDE